MTRKTDRSYSFSELNISVELYQCDVIIEDVFPQQDRLHAVCDTVGSSHHVSFRDERSTTEIVNLPIPLVPVTDGDLPGPGISPGWFPVGDPVGCNGVRYAALWRYLHRRSALLQAADSGVRLLTRT